MDVTTDQVFSGPATVAFKNARGEDAPVQGAPSWASSDATVLRVTPAEDGMSATVDIVAAGTARITVSADADLGDGVVTITGVTEDINVTVGPKSQASVVTLTLPPLADKP